MRRRGVALVAADWVTGASDRARYSVGCCWRSARLNNDISSDPKASADILVPDILIRVLRRSVPLCSAISHSASASASASCLHCICLSVAAATLQLSPLVLSSYSLSVSTSTYFSFYLHTYCVGYCHTHLSNPVADLAYRIRETSYSSCTLPYMYCTIRVYSDSLALEWPPRLIHSLVITSLFLVIESMILKY